jgi:choline dehydrogenase
MSFDYIIIGGGSAGCVLASRLSESGAHRVLLLEAGGSDKRLWIQMPIGYGMSFYNPKVNWMYRTEPEAALDGRQGYWPRGKVLGGSGSINAMVHIRGQAGDFDDWREAGNPGWGWSDVLPYFKKSEDFAEGDKAWRGVGGPLHVTDVSRDCHKLCAAYLEAGEAIGLKRTRDFNGAQFDGVGVYQIATRNGFRMSASRAYLWPAMKRRNLRVETGAHATRLLFEGRRATGVEYRQNGTLHKAEAAGEIILAGGSINSPQLLQLSGVGPAGVLQPLGIPMVLDSPAVGRNLQDHLCIDHIYRSRLPTLNDVLGPWSGRIRVGLDYVLRRRGPLAMSINQGGGFIRARADLARPNIQLYFSPMSYTRAQPGKRRLMSPDAFPGFILSAQQCRPTSRGHLEIASADPFAPPRIVPNSLATEHDLQEQLEGTKFLRRLAAAPSLAAVIDEELRPGPAVQSDADFIADFRRRASTVFHPVSTCRMGPDPRESVVDASLKVHGIEGLRIIDASVFPNVTSGNTNAPTLMVAEKGADLVLQDRLPLRPSGRRGLG